MIALITHTSEVAPAAFMAMLAASTTLTLAVGVSGATARGCACAVLLSSVALGFGLWATNFVAVLSFWLPERSTVGVTGLIVPLAIAASSQMCALLFIACREPDTSEIAGSAFALAFGVSATHCAVLGDPLGQLVPPDEFLWLCGSFALTFAAYFAALWVWVKRRHDRSWRAAGVRFL